MCLQTQGIDDDGSVGGVRQDQGVGNDDVGVCRGQIIDYAYDGSETTMEAARIWERQRRLQSCDNGPDKLETPAEASAEEDDPEDSTATIYVLAEETEETTRLSERL